MHLSNPTHPFGEARVFEKFLEPGPILKEDIIKLQHKVMTTSQRWRGKSYDFYLIGHEHL